MRRDAWGPTIQMAALVLYAVFALIGMAKADFDPRPRSAIPTPLPRRPEPDPRGGRPIPVPPARPVATPFPTPIPRRPEPDPRGGRPIPAPLPRPNPRGMCPPNTVLDPRINRCVSALSPSMRAVPPRTQDPDEISAANIVNQSMMGLTCDQASESLRKLSNLVLSMASQSVVPSVPGRPDPDFKRAARERIHSSKFWMNVWNRMADAYRSCNRGCFDDGQAVGEISATGYCAASVAVNGLMGPGFTEQPPLPVCESAVRAGCIQNYQTTAANFSGCRPYTVDSFDSIFREYISQDCHL